MKKIINIKTVLLALLCLITMGGSTQVTTGALLADMIDLQGLSEYPSPPFETMQYSSYDRHSLSPDQPGWFNNSDGFGGESIPGFEAVLQEPGEDGKGRYLICDVKGPGAVVRLWTAWIVGDLEVYLDGNETALYKGNAQDFFYYTYDAIAGTEAKYNQEGIFFQNTAGYYPIPFSKGFKMIFTGKIEDLHFYHVQVREYASGTNVETFTLEDLEKYKEDIDHVAIVLNDPLQYHQSEAPKIEANGVINPGKEKTFVTLHGAEAISQLKIYLEAEDRSAALRQSILKVYFDGASTAQVQSPVGDFFGAAPGINPYKSLPLSVMPDGSMICNYYMPFRDSAEIVIQNLGQQDVVIHTEIITEAYQWNENSMYFRARWRVDHGLFASYRPSQDIPYLMASGKGVCVGAAAYIYNPTSVPSSWGNWWGEGDEKIYLDQASFPAFFGTGSEDYYNYAWSSSAIFTHAYCGQPRNDGPANRGFVTNYRWHILDKIPFNTGIAFYMELMSHEPVENFSYARMIYLYAKRGMYDDHLPITEEDARILELPENWLPVGRKGSHEAKFFQAEELVNELESIELEYSTLWSGDYIMVWEAVSNNQSLILDLPLKEAGNYTIVFTAGLDTEGGSFRVKTGDIVLEFRGQYFIDLHDPYRILSRNFRSAPVSLEKGLNQLIIEPIEGNEGAIKIDFIWLMKSR